MSSIGFCSLICFLSFLFNWCSHRESNPDLWLRRPLFYPLNYGCVVAWFIGLSMTGFKLFHEGNEGVYAGFGKGVVDGGSDATDGTVAFEGF